MSDISTSDQEIEEYKLLGQYLILLIESSDFSDDEKAGWVAALPFMSMEQIMRLFALLQGQLEERFKEEYADEISQLSKILTDYQTGREERAQATIAELDALEKEFIN